MLLSKDNLTRHVASKDPGDTLRVLRIEREGVVSTDRHRLMVTPLPHQPATDFPHLDGFDPTGELGADDALAIPVEAAAKVAKALPNKAKYPVLQCAALDTKRSLANGSVYLATTDLESPSVVEAKRPDNGDFPKWRQVVPGGKPAFTIGVNGRYLAEVAKMLDAMGERDGVRLDFYGDKPEDCAVNPMRLSIQTPDGEAWCLIMPMRL